MRSQYVIAGATLGAASLFAGTDASATPAQGCVFDPTQLLSQTCTLLEPGTSETSSVTNLISNFTNDSAWLPGYYVISDPLGSVSDYVVFRDECAPFGVCGYADQAVLYSVDDGGTIPDLTGLTQHGGTITEDANGFAQFSPEFVADVSFDRAADTFDVFSPPEATATPEPLTLSIFGAGFAGAIAMRRRRKEVKAS